MMEPEPRQLGDEAERPKVPSREWVYRTLADFARELYPQAKSCRLVIDVPDGDGVTSASLPIPLGVSDDAAAEDRIVAFLSGFSPETWVKGRVIAAELDMEYGGGQFGKLMSGLTQERKILESSKAGYRLKST